MTSLKYNDKHNQVAFLKKPTESAGFHEIVDFLKATPLRYALTHNPTIYDSLVKQFWQTATVRTLANGIQELVASIDNNEYVITEASVRSKLQLADATGIHNLPDAEIYDGLATLGYVSEGKLTFWKNHFTPPWKFLVHTILHCISPKSGGWDQFGSPIATALICLSSNRVYNFSKLIFDGMGICWESCTVAACNDRSCSTGLRSIHREDFEIPQSPGPTLTFIEDEATTTSVGVGNTSGSAEDNLKLKELSKLVPKLVMKIDSLEKQLKETKQTFGHAVIKLVERVKSLEFALKRKSRKVILSESEGEEPENQGRKIKDIDDDPLVSLARSSMNECATYFITPSKVSASGEAQEKDISLTTIEAARTLSQVASEGVSTYKRRRRSSDTDSDVNTDLDFFSTVKERIKTTKLNIGSSQVKSGGAKISTDKGQREGKAQMTEEDIQATEKKRLQLEQERAGLEEAARLQAQMDAEVAKQIHMDEMVAKRMQEEEELSEQQKKRRDEV
ncbi:hypothetical protein Tco_0730801 [Tanacetum coccineum]